MSKLKIASKSVPLDFDEIKDSIGIEKEVVVDGNNYLMRLEEVREKRFVFRMWQE